MDALVSRAAELDGENRKLREAKYELDTKVGGAQPSLGDTEGPGRQKGRWDVLGLRCTGDRLVLFG